MNFAAERCTCFWDVHARVVYKLKDKDAQTCAECLDFKHGYGQPSLSSLIMTKPVVFPFLCKASSH